MEAHDAEEANVIPRSALAVAVLVVGAGLAIYAIRSGLADDPVSTESRPEIEGRLVNTILGTTPTGAYEIKCEFDALVDIEGETVVNVKGQGDAGKVQAGDKIAESIYEPDRPEADSRLESGPLGQRQSDISVYWGKDGKLHAGCAPESIKTENGVSAPLGERP